jgi:hypothetical protein
MAMTAPIDLRPLRILFSPLAEKRLLADRRVAEPEPLVGNAVAVG